MAKNFVDFSNNVNKFLEGLDSAKLRRVLKESYKKTSEQARQIALRRLRSKNFVVKGNKADFEAGLRSHIYSGGGGFLLTVRGRRGRTGSGAGEKGMHENRYYGKTSRRLPILQWLEYGTKERVTRKTRRKTGRIKPAHFLTDSEAEITTLVEDETMKVLKDHLSNITKHLGNNSPQF